VPNEFCIPVGKGRSEGGQEAFDVAFSGVDEGGEGVVVNGRGSGLAVMLILVLESGHVDDSAATESLCLVSGRDSHCGRQLLRQTDGHVVVAESSSSCGVGGGVVLLVSHTVVAETHVELSVEGGRSLVGVVDGRSIGDLLATIVAINSDIFFVVRDLHFIWNIRVCG